MQILMHPSLYRNKCRNGIPAKRSFRSSDRCAVQAGVQPAPVRPSASYRSWCRKRFSTGSVSPQFGHVLGQTCGRISRCRDRFDRVSEWVRAGVGIDSTGAGMGSAGAGVGSAGAGVGSAGAGVGFGWGRDRFSRRWSGFDRRWNGFSRCRDRFSRVPG